MIANFPQALIAAKRCFARKWRLATAGLAALAVLLGMLATPTLREWRVISLIRKAGGDVRISQRDSLLVPGVKIPYSRYFNKRQVAVYAGSQNADAVLKYAAELPRIDNLWIINSNVSAEGLSHLANYGSVGVLSIQRTALEDSDLQFIAKMPALEAFMYIRTKNSPEALAQLGAAMPKTHLLDGNPLADRQERELRENAE